MSAMMKQQAKKEMCVVIPVANESETLVELCREILEAAASWEEQVKTRIFFVVDRVSTDNTLEIVESLHEGDPRVELVWAPENQCVADAYVTGFNAALKDYPDYVLEMDAGFSHLPVEMHLFVEKLLEGYDCVFGSRFQKAHLMDSNRLRFFLSKGGTLLAYLILGMGMTDSTSGFEGFQADVLRKILSRRLVSRGHFFQTEIRFRARKFNYIEVPIHYKSPSNRVSGKSLRNAAWGLFVCFMERIRGY
jgi:dolichol-phosphate mannosyltransferase